MMPVDFGFPQVLRTISSVLSGETEIYLVGGAIRDGLLGIPSHDLDFAVFKDSGRIARRVANALNAPFYMLDRERDTARVILQYSDGSPYSLDFAGFRGENIIEDLSTRDFTVNAMAVNLAEPALLIDPLGGQEDLSSRRLRACSDTSFMDDPVRIFRGVRLALAYQFELLPEAKLAMQSAATRLPQVSIERKRDELFRILEGHQISRAIRLLDNFGALGSFLPEINELKEVEQSSPHFLDVWEHTLLTVDHLELLLDDLILQGDCATPSANWQTDLARHILGCFKLKLADHFAINLTSGRSRRAALCLAALFHDTGKPGSSQVSDTGRIRFLGHDLKGVMNTVNRAQELALSQTEVDYLRVLIKQHMRVHFLANAASHPSRKSIFHFFRDTGSAGIDICLLSLADLWATFGPALPIEKWEAELTVCADLLDAWWERHDEVITPPRILTGDDLQKEFKMVPGPNFGKILAGLDEASAVGEIHVREDALRYVRTWLEEHTIRSSTP
jgi:poly(A) polymerase